MSWRSKSSDRPFRVDDEVAFRPSRRFLRFGPAGPRRPRRGRRKSALFPPRLWKGVFLVILAASLVTVWYAGRQAVPQLLRLRYFQITELVVEGNRRVPTTAIIRALGLPARVTTLEVNVRDLASRVMASPWIRTASVTRRLPSGLLVRVSERTARAVVLTDSTFLVSDDGLVLKKAEAAEEMHGLPILRLNLDSAFGPGERIDAARLDPGVRLWRLLHRDALGPGVDVLEIRMEDDGSSTVSLGHRLPYLRVREPVTRIQLDRLARVLQVRGIGLHELEYADLRFADKIIVKPRKIGEET